MADSKKTDPAAAKPDQRKGEGDRRSSCGDRRHGPADRRRTINDSDYAITPFPEIIGRFFFPKYPYLFWALAALPLLFFRLITMILCGEEHGRFASNIAYAILPSILAMLIIWYSKQTKSLAKILFNIVQGEEQGVISAEYEKMLQDIFGNRLMIILGLIFTVCCTPLVLYGQLYPTPSHNIIHREKLRDRINVNVGRWWPNEEEGAKSSHTWGWVQLPLGKVIRLAHEGNPQLYEVLTETPQETYDSHPPDPTVNENLKEMDPEARRELDPGWDPLFRNKVPPATEDERRREFADTLIYPLNKFYLSHSIAELWGFSQLTYLAIMIPLLFMSGALIRCLYGIVKMSWCFGRQTGRKGKCIWSNIHVDVFPHPSKSISAVGRLLWRVAVIHGSIYSIVMVCKYFTRPDTTSLTVACLFSLMIVALFVVPQFNLHELMVRAKYDKIGSLDTQLTKALNEVAGNTSRENLERANNILELQKTLASASEWPCELHSLAMVVSSVIVPIIMAVFALYQHFQ